MESLYPLAMKFRLASALWLCLFACENSANNDLGPNPDAGEVQTDSGQDTGQDAGPPDTGPAPDAGDLDAGTPDAGAPDAGQGCPRSGTPTETDPPQVQIAFARQDALIEAGQTIVSGTASDESEICSLTVNGVEAESEDGFSTWLAVLDLQDDFQGPITVEAQDAWGTVGTQTGPTLTSQPFLPSGPIGAAVVQASGETYLVSTDNGRSGTLYKQNLQTQEVTRILPKTRRFFGTRVGPSLQPDRFLAVGVDEGTGAAQVLEIELPTGSSTLLWSSDTGPRLQSVTLLPDGTLLGMSNEGPQLLELGAGGASTVRSSSDPAAMVGAGPGLGDVQDIHWDTAGSRLLVGNRSNDAAQLIEIDLMTGDRTLLAEVFPMALTGFALDAAGGQAYFTGLSRVLLVNIDLGTLIATEISSENMGSGPRPVARLGVALDPAAGLAYVPAKDEQAFYSVDVVSGARTRIDPLGRGAGLRPGQYSSYFVEETTGRFITTDTRRGGRIFEVDPSTGDRAVLAEPNDARLRNLSHLVAVGGAWYALDAFASAVVEIDPASGAITPISSTGGALGAVGDGPAIGLSPVMTAGGAVLWVAAQEQVMEVTIATGARRLVSANGVGSGPLHGFAGGVVFEPGTGALLVSDPRNQWILSVDTMTGDRSILQEGVELLGAQGLFLAPSGRVFVAAGRSIAAFDPMQTSGLDSWFIATAPDLHATHLSVGADERFVQFLSVPSNTFAELDTQTGAAVILSY